MEVSWVSYFCLGWDHCRNMVNKRQLSLLSGFLIGAIQASPACEPENQSDQAILESRYPSCSGGCHPSELSVLGQDPRAGTERSGWEVTPAISAHSQHPRLWIQGFAALFARPAFVCFFSSSCSIQQPPLTTCPPVWRPWPLEASAKASSQRLGQHVPRLIGSSQHPASPGLANKKGGGVQSCTHGSLQPHTQSGGDKDIFHDGRCWYQIPPRVNSQKKGRESWAPQAAQTCRGRRVGRAPWEETGSRPGRGQRRRVGV